MTLIKREDAIDAIDDAIDVDSPQWAILRTKIGFLPSAEAVHGEWIFNPTDAIDLMFAKPKCSKCGFESSDGGNFCPNCGVRMKGGEALILLPIDMMLEEHGLADEARLVAIEALKGPRPKIAFACDGRKCGKDCSECGRTTDIEHAKNFTRLGESYLEILPVAGPCKSDHDHDGGEWIDITEGLTGGDSDK